MAKSSPYTQYRLSKRDITRSGFKFELTYIQWKKIWDESGQFENRGNKHGSYQMARINPYGAFTIDNIQIVKRKLPDTIHRKYVQHQRNADVRGIKFLLTFYEWWKIWEDSGRWNERGTKEGKYCMARKGDRGPYAVGNVEIVLHKENTAQGKGWKHTPETIELLRERARARNSI